MVLGLLTIRTIYRALYNILNSLDDNKITIAMCVVLTNDSDSVNHEILCKKLNNKKNSP